MLHAQGTAAVLADRQGLLPLLHSLEEHVRSGTEVGSLAEEVLEQVSFWG